MEPARIKTALIDGYLDEPSCLGVPPYISPNIRYTYGALLTAGIREDNLQYYTIDQLRRLPEKGIDELEKYELVIIISGTTVPGHYLGGKPASMKEIRELGERLFYPQKILGGPLTMIRTDIENYDHICREIAALDIYQLLTDKTIPPEELTGYISRWAVVGAGLTTRHPNYPNLVCELETYRGCPRSSHCAFCSERLKKITYHRPPRDIIAEVKALTDSGNRFFRLGCQTDLLLYQGERNSSGILVPSPEPIGELYRGIRETAPELKTLHLDNINPASISNHPGRAREIIETIVRYNTGGDVAAFGLESADPLVLKKNNIETDPARTFKAIELMNEIGRVRKDGLPALLPGLNFLHGLTGERRETLEYNYQYLKDILEAGLLLRRINIRQVMNTGNYPVSRIEQGRFNAYKEKINREINRPMLQNVFPVGTVLRDILTETRKGKITFGRQLGSYPILVGIPGNLDPGCFVDVRVIDHGYRSITALPWPFKIKKASLEQLAAFPGIGKKRANKIFLEQPESIKELQQLLDPTFPLEQWKDWFDFS